MYQLEVGLPWVSGNLFQFECCGHLNRLSPSCILLAASSPSATWMPARYLQQDDLCYVAVLSKVRDAHQEQASQVTGAQSQNIVFFLCNLYVLHCIFFKMAEMLEGLNNFSAWFFVQGCLTFAPLSFTRELRGQRIQKALNRHGTGAMQRKELVGKTSGKSHVEGSRYQNIPKLSFSLIHTIPLTKVLERAIFILHPAGLCNSGCSNYREKKGETKRGKKEKISYNILL